MVNKFYIFARSQSPTFAFNLSNTNATVIVLPRELFITTDISVTLWILNQNKKGGKYHGRNLRNREHEILFMDLRQWTENPIKGENKKKVILSSTQNKEEISFLRISRVSLSFNAPLARRNPATPLVGFK